MSCNVKREDLRIIKTKKALNTALSRLLNRQRFSKITVNDVCVEALVSRTAFYAHYKDKYDLLGQWLSNIHMEYLGEGQKMTLEQVKDIFANVVHEQYAVIINLFEDADSEQEYLIMQFVAKIVNLSCVGIDAILLDFITGGILSVVYKHSNSCHKSDEEVKYIIEYLYNTVYGVMLLDINCGKS